jgi:hypothetical protein
MTAVIFFGHSASIFAELKKHELVFVAALFFPAQMKLDA